MQLVSMVTLTTFMKKKINLTYFRKKKSVLTTNFLRNFRNHFQFLYNHIALNSETYSDFISKALVAL